LSESFTWVILTGEYPPHIGGVSDYTHHLARALVEAGDRVHVWTPAPVPAAPAPCDPGVIVHQLPDQYSPRSLMKLQRELREIGGPYRLLLQYTPNAFGLLGTNYAFALWLIAQRMSPWVMFHELYMPLTREQPMRYNALAIAQRVMLKLMMQSTARAFVSIPIWGELLQDYANGTPIEWLPIPSAVVGRVEPAQLNAIRGRYLSADDQKLLGTFGTYGPLIADMLNEILPPLLKGDPRRVMLLMGRGSESFAAQLLAAHPQLAERVHFTGSLPADQLPAYLSACDLLVQPYPDGVSTRRSSLVAGMALGVPTVAPAGKLSESFWLEKNPIIVVPEPRCAAILAAAERALADPQMLRAFGRKSQQFYDEVLDVRHTVAALRS
jgi:glycosyltransferase involved in cell wall biosynthesis